MTATLRGGSFIAYFAETKELHYTQFHPFLQAAKKHQKSYKINTDKGFVRLQVIEWNGMKLNLVD